MSTKPAVGLCPDISIAAGDPLVRERVGPDPEVSHRAQEGQGCADHDVSGRRRAAEAPRVAQKPRTSLTIALTDTAASGPELQRRPCATSRRRGRYPPLRIRRSRTGIGRHAREQRPDGRCNLVASRPRRAAGSAHSGDGGLRVGESGDSRTRNSPRARVGANSLADGARAAPFVSGRPWGTATRSAITRPGMSSWPTPAPAGSARCLRRRPTPGEADQRRDVLQRRVV